MEPQWGSASASPSDRAFPAAKPMEEQPSTSSGPGPAVKRHRSPVIDLGVIGPPGQLVADPDNDLGNLMHRNKRYLSEVRTLFQLFQLPGWDGSAANAVAATIWAHNNCM